ncbi:IncF plasmid conjugative transfer pilus assembly protein TraB [Thiorhodococcus drewsii AZ1]|uniref:IncF plasmid conjugative transfer pilus assembly protein TraB n=1 Tax=Thiorhodococcus drewsii AZ1 TaxID=765913 RepID=G2DYR4_9GAMM|nr:TrbI/VirB10 family protein [Thiorhodococcus drewsii]EGV32691.1 IncF plasmid conjugative transfer pilus assembly protein TraB [Thiorhodococcus drewsii AZ1]
MPLSIDSTWGRLSPNLRRGLVITGVLGGIAAILVLAFGQPEPRAVREQRAREQLTRTLLTDVDPRALGIDGLARRLERLEQQLAAATGAIARQDARETHAVDREVAALREAQETQFQDLQRQIAVLKAEMAVSRAASATKPQRPERTETATESPPSSPPALDDPALFAPATDGTGGLKALTPNRASSRSRTAPLTIRVVAQEPQAKDETAKAAMATTSDPATEQVMIPAGSILRGVLLSGMDAPTGVQARRDPYPALVRLKHAAILPNRFRSDVRECFVLVAGFGELSSERAFLRTETVTCVRRDGGVIEVPLDGYAVGEDGKVGLRGRLVSKQGQVIAQALQVAFLEGVAQVFNKTPVSVLSTRSDGQVQYQDLLSGDSLQAAAVSGTGKTLDRLAQYYLDMAEEIFPVIEIDAGRPIELILNRGASLQLRAPRGRRR